MIIITRWFHLNSLHCRFAHRLFPFFPFSFVLCIFSVWMKWKAFSHCRYESARAKNIWTIVVVGTAVAVVLLGQVHWLSISNYDIQISNAHLSLHSMQNFLTLFRNIYRAQCRFFFVWTLNRIGLIVTVRLSQARRMTHSFLSWSNKKKCTEMNVSQ